MGKKAFTVTLQDETYLELVEMAKEESRPPAQMARVIIEKAVKSHTANSPLKSKKKNA